MTDCDGPARPSLSCLQVALEPDQASLPCGPGHLLSPNDCRAAPVLPRRRVPAQSCPALLRPHGLLCPWDFPGEDTGEVAMSCSRFPDPGIAPASLASPTPAGLLYHWLPGKPICSPAHTLISLPSVSYPAARG